MRRNNFPSPPPSKKRKATTVSRTPVTAPSLILCFGDSNTYGQSDVSDERLPYTDRWTTALQQQLGDDFLVMPEGLNGRTTVIDDPWENAEFCGMDGAGMNGRRYLLPCLYSHRPIAAVVLALGTNDLKHRHNLEPSDVVAGMQNLIADCLKSAAGPDGKPPRIVLLSPPALKETSQAVGWGFRGSAAKSRQTIDAMRRAAAERRLPFVDLSAVSAIGADGIHFAAEAAQPIGVAVSAAVLSALS